MHYSRFWCIFCQPLDVELAKEEFILLNSYVPRSVAFLSLHSGFTKWVNLKIEPKNIEFNSFVITPHGIILLGKWDLEKRIRSSNFNANSKKVTPSNLIWWREEWGKPDCTYPDHLLLE